MHQIAPHLKLPRRNFAVECAKKETEVRIKDMKIQIEEDMTSENMGTVPNMYRVIFNNFNNSRLKRK